MRFVYAGDEWQIKTLYFMHEHLFKQEKMYLAVKPSRTDVNDNHMFSDLKQSPCYTVNKRNNIK